jgi:hypothetical protein
VRLKKLAVGAVTIVSLLILSSSVFFYYRDNLATHFPAKKISADAFRQGAIPFYNFSVGGGQPLAGNPNLLTFYPDNVLYLLLPAHIAFNLHFLIHLALAFFAMRALLLLRGISGRSALLAATMYVACGPVLSSTAFYNLVTATALVPAALAALESLLARTDWKRASMLGTVWGLIVLAGEPMVGIGTALLSLIVLGSRLTFRSLPPLATAAFLAVLIASPLIVSWNEISVETERGGRRYSADTVLAASLPPWRLAEMFAGPLFGSTVDRTASGFAANAPLLRWPPLFGSLFLGGLALAAWASAFRGRQLPFATAALVLTFLALGRFNPLVRLPIEELESLRFVRYPEKLVLHLTVVLFVCVAELLDRPARQRLVQSMLLLTALIAPAVALFRPTSPVILRAGIAAVLAIALLVIARRFPDLSRYAAPMVLATLLAWGSTSLLIDLWAPYRDALRQQSANGEVRLHRRESAEPDLRSSRDLHRHRAAAMQPTFSSAAGVRYVADRSPDGMYSLLSRVVQERVSAAPDSHSPWLRSLGATHVATTEGLVALPAPVARVRPALRVIEVDSVNEAVAVIETRGFDDATAVVPRTKKAPLAAPATIGTIEESVDTIRFTVSSTAGATLMTTETWFAAWQAQTSHGSLRTFPVNVDRLGIEVPPGTIEVELRFGRRRTIVGALLALSILLQLAALTLYCSRSRNSTAEPAR